MTSLRLELPTAPGELLLWSHVCLIWILVNYVHRWDPLTRAEAREVEGPKLRRWRQIVVFRAVAGALLVTTLAGFQLVGLGLGSAFLLGAALLPLARFRWMRANMEARGRDLRAEGELALNVLYFVGSAFLIGAGQLEMSLVIVELPVPPMSIVSVLLAATGAFFLLRGGTHVVRGVLEKTDTLPEEFDSLEVDDLRHGVTIGNIERLLIYGFALAGSHAAIGLVIAAKGIVRAIEWQDRTLIEYFLIGSLASAGLAALIGIGLGWLLRGF